MSSQNPLHYSPGDPVVEEEIMLSLEMKSFQHALASQFAGLSPEWSLTPPDTLSNCWLAEVRLHVLTHKYAEAVNVHFEYSHPATWWGQFRQQYKLFTRRWPVKQTKVTFDQAVEMHREFYFPDIIARQPHLVIRDFVQPLNPL